MNNQLLLQGGKALGSTASQVPKKYLDSTIKYALKDAGLSGAKYSVVGNTSSEFLGDVDIAIDIEDLIKKWSLPKQHYSKEFWDAIKNKIQNLEGAKVTSGLKVFHIPGDLVDAAGNKLPSYKDGKEIADSEGKIQIDVFVGNLEWMKDIISGKPEHSNFKAVFRNIFLMTIVSTIERYNTKPDENGEYDEYKYALQISSGVEKVITHFAMPSGKSKNPKPLSAKREPFINNQNELAQWIFGKGMSWKDIDSFEKIANNFDNNQYFNKKYGMYKEQIMNKLKDGYSSDQLEQIKNSEFSKTFNLEESLNERLLLETGASGHLNHLYDNPDLTFAKIKEIFNAAASGNLEGAEKTDGQNMSVSYSIKDGRIKGARNSTHIKSGGLTPEQVLTTFEDHGNKDWKFVFSDSLKALERAIHTLSQKEQMSIFGDNTDIFLSVEMLDPRMRNTINYDVKALIIHKTGTLKYDRQNDKVIPVDFPKEAEKLTSALKDEQQELEDTRYSIQADAIRKLQALSDKRPLHTAINSLNSLMSNVNSTIKNDSLTLTDNSTVFDFMLLRVYILVTSTLQKGKIKNFDPVAKMNITKKILGVKGISPKDISSKVSKDQLEFVKQNLLNDVSKKEILKTSILPLEQIVHDFAIKMLSGLKSLFLIDDDKEIKRLRTTLQDAINKIQSSDNEKHMSVLKQQMAKIKKIENISSGAEGFVFDYDGKTYKFTGNFAPMNQILGIFKYGSKKEENKPLTEAKIKTERIALIPGAFKPPHKAHLALVKQAAKVSDRVIVYISPLGRQLTKTDTRNVTAQMSQKIWNLYLKAEGLANKAEVRIATVNSPVITTFDFISNKNDNPEYSQAGQTIILFSGTQEGDDKRFAYSDFSKVAKKGVNVELRAEKSPVGISGTKMREAIANNDKKKLMSFLPDSVDKKEVCELIMSMFNTPKSISENQLYDIIKEEISKCGNKYSLIKRKKVKKENSTSTSVAGYGSQLVKKVEK